MPPLLLCHSIRQSVHLSLCIFHLFITHRDTAQTHRCLVGLVPPQLTRQVFVSHFLFSMAISSRVHVTPQPALSVCWCICQTLLFYSVSASVSLSVCLFLSLSLKIAYLKGPYGPKNSNNRQNQAKMTNKGQKLD